MEPISTTAFITLISLTIGLLITVTMMGASIYQDNKVTTNK